MLSHHRFGPEVDDLARALQRALGLQPKSTATYAFAAGETPNSFVDRVSILIRGTNFKEVILAFWSRYCGCQLLLFVSD